MILYVQYDCKVHDNPSHLVYENKEIDDDGSLQELLFMLGFYISQKSVF